MLMAVDIGNTQTVLGLFEGEELRERWRMATEVHRTAEELGSASAGLLRLRGLELEQVGALIVSSVVPGLTRSYKNLAEEVLKVPFYPVTALMETGIKNRYDDPEAVGADRIVNAVAAGRYYGFPAIVVDFGTATTVCVIDAEGTYRGGAILPGLYVSLEALISRTAKLPSVDALIRRMSEELTTDAPIEASAGKRYDTPAGLRVLATGGPAPVIVRHCREIDVLDADLTLKGLCVLYELNAR